MSNGGALVGKSYRSYAVNNGLVAKVVEAVKLGDADARKRGQIRSFEVYIMGDRQNLVIGQVLVIPPQVADTIEDFPVALLYGAMCKELSPEANADILTYKLGESEYDEYKDSDMSEIKDRLFKDAQGKYRSIVLFIPSWSNPRNYVLFKFVKDEELLAQFVRHQIFAAYFDPALSSSFDQLLTNLDTSKFDVTDITPKLNYPFLAESPFKQYPQLQDLDKVDVKTASSAALTLLDKIYDKIYHYQAGNMDVNLTKVNEALQRIETTEVPHEFAAELSDAKRSMQKYEDYGDESYLSRAATSIDDMLRLSKQASHNSVPKIFMTAALTEDFAADHLEPGEKKTLDALSKDLKKGLEGEITKPEDLKTDEDNQGLQQRPDYGSPESHSADMNGKNKSAADRIQTYPAWKSKVKKMHPEAVFEGDIDICQAFSDASKENGVGEWEGSYGEVYEVGGSPKHAAKKADAVALDADPDTSHVGDDVEKAVGALPAVAEAISMVAGAETKYSWALKQNDKGEWVWAIKGGMLSKIVAQGKAADRKAADADMKKKLDELQGRTPEPTGNDSRLAKKQASFGGVKGPASEMDPWIAQGLGLTPREKEASSPIAKKASQGEMILEIDGCTFEKVDNPSRAKVPGSFLRSIYKATSPEGVVDHPAFDGARFYWDNPEDFPASFRMAVEKYFKGINKAAKRHQADVPTDIDDIWSETMEDFGEAPMVEVGSTPAPTGDDFKEEKAEKPTSSSSLEDAESFEKKDGETSTKSEEASKPAMEPAKKKPSEPAQSAETEKKEPSEEPAKEEAKPFEKKEASKLTDLCPICATAIKDHSSRMVIDRCKRLAEAKKKESSKKAAFTCDYCGAATGNVTRICDGCENDMECELCGKKFVETPEESGYTEIRPDIFAHESCISKAKTAAFNMYIPGQVAESFYPELLHETIDYPNDSNSPMLDNGVLDPGPGYISTSPSPAMGLGNNGKPEVLDGAPLKKPELIRGFQFNDEFYQQYEGLSGGSLRAASVLKRISKKAGKDENKRQFIDFLKKVVGEVAATFLAAFKVTSRGILTEVPGLGEIQLANIEQPAIQNFNLINTGSRVEYLLSFMNDTDIQDALNEAWAQASVHNDSPEGGFVYEVFVRGQSIDVDSMTLRYEYVVGQKGV